MAGTSDLLYRPHKQTMLRAWRQGGTVRAKYRRGSSSSYINRPEVRAFIFSRDGEDCLLCGASDDIGIDHKNPVFFADKETIFSINHVDNLRPLCRGCNSGRSL